MDILGILTSPSYLISILACAFIELRALSANSPQIGKPRIVPRDYLIYLMIMVAVTVLNSSFRHIVPNEMAFRRFVTPAVYSLLFFTSRFVYATKIYRVESLPAAGMVLGMLTINTVGHTFGSIVYMVYHFYSLYSYAYLGIMSAAIFLPLYFIGVEAILVRYWPRRRNPVAAATILIPLLFLLLAHFHRDRFYVLSAEFLGFWEMAGFDELSALIAESPESLITLVLTVVFLALPVLLGLRARALAGTSAAQGGGIAGERSLRKEYGRSRTTDYARPEMSSAQPSKEKPEPEPVRTYTVSDIQFERQTATIRRNRMICRILAVLFCLPVLFFLRKSEAGYLEAEKNRDVRGMETAVAQMWLPAVAGIFFGLIVLWLNIVYN